MKRSRPSTRGLTLVELLVATLVGSLIVVAAVQVASDHSLLLGKTSADLDMAQSARLGVELLGYDLHMAGAGVGYRADGRFAGIRRGTFTVPGGASFNGNDRSIALATGNLQTDDVGIMHAHGRARTIAMHSGSMLEVCRGSDLEAGDVAMLQSRDGIFARTVSVDSLTAGSCTDGVCLGGCDSVVVAPNSTYRSHWSADTANFVEGEIVGGFEQVVWFVAPDARGVGELRRAEVSPASPCAGADSTCGGAVAIGIETLQLRVMQWDEVNQAWDDATGLPDIPDRRRVRIDIEVVARGRTDMGRTPQEPVQLTLGGGCVPGPCGQRDTVERTVIRTSVDVRNSTRHQML